MYKHLTDTLESIPPYPVKNQCLPLGEIFYVVLKIILIKKKKYIDWNKRKIIIIISKISSRHH